METTVDRPVTRFPRSRDHGEPFEVPASADRQQESPNRLKRRYQLPPRLPLDVDVPNVRHGKRPRDFCLEKSPWECYREILSENQAGPVVIAKGRSEDFPSVAIKHRQVSSHWDLRKLLKISHVNVVALLEAFVDDNQLFLIYDSVRVSLKKIHSSPYGPYSEQEISTICKGV